MRDDSSKDKDADKWDGGRYKYIHDCMQYSPILIYIITGGESMTSLTSPWRTITFKHIQTKKIKYCSTFLPQGVGKNPLPALSSLSWFMHDDEYQNDSMLETLQKSPTVIYILLWLKRLIGPILVYIILTSFLYMLSDRWNLVTSHRERICDDF